MVLDDFGFFDYTAESSGIYEYTSTEYTQVIKSLVGDGVVNGRADMFETTANGLTIRVATGFAFVDGHYGHNKSVKTIPLDATGSDAARTDLLVLRADSVNRTVGIEVLKGTTGVPTLTQTTEIYEIPLYRCAVAGGTVTLTDERDIIYTPTEAMEKMQAITDGTDHVYAVYS